MNELHMPADSFDILMKPQYKGIANLVIADPPYGGIVYADWNDEECYDNISGLLQHIMHKDSTAYVWGGIGTWKNRPFLKWLSEIESKTDLKIRNLITWSKKRAYGKKDNYLFTREECVMLIKGKPVFNIPLLDTKRGYEGYNAKYPAKSEFLRRTNVWTDITEIFKGKIHECQKPEQLHNVMITTSSNEGDQVIDPFAGCGGVAAACRKLNRDCISVELNPCQQL